MFRVATHLAPMFEFWMLVSTTPIARAKARLVRDISKFFLVGGGGGRGDMPRVKTRKKISCAGLNLLEHPAC